MTTQPAENIPGQEAELGGAAGREMHSELQTEQETRTLELLDSVYDSLLNREQREAGPDDQISVVIGSESTEAGIMQEAGVSIEKIEQGTFTRQELLDVGFGFINVLGSGEKGLISGIVTDHDSGQSTDFTGRKLLTNEELEMVYISQQAQPEVYSLQGQDIGEVRKDMMSFLMEASAQPLFGSEAQLVVDVMNDQSFMYGERVDGYSLEDWRVVEDYVAKRAQSYVGIVDGPEKYQARSTAQEELIQEYCGDLYQWIEAKDQGGAFNAKTVRGHSIKSLMMMRSGSLQGQPSPFLESGFVFGGNLDANVFTSEDDDLRSKDQFRMNVATLHLSGGHPDFPGFSEMGGTSADQQYMPVGYYVQNLFSGDSNERQQLHAGEDASLIGTSRRDVLRDAQARLIEAVRSINESETPVHVIGFRGLVPMSTWEKVRQAVGRPSKKRKIELDNSQVARETASDKHRTSRGTVSTPDN